MASTLRRKEQSNELSKQRLARPGKIAGIAGMVLVAALYMAHALLLKLDGEGLGAPWLLLLVLPGMLAAHLSRRASERYSPEGEGVLAGLLIAHFAAILQIIVLVISVLNVDWAAYSVLVGSDIGNGVHAMAVPATAVASVVMIAVTYTGCVLASWLGALAYAKVMSYEL
jgi:hypothetical protein